MRSHSSRLAILALLAAAFPAAGQLSPVRTYYGVNRSMPMTVAIPKDTEGDAKIELHQWGEPSPLAEASVTKGGVDMAALFPQLWTDAPRVLYAQLTVDGKPVGPAVVMQPMTVPAKAVIFSPENRQVWGVDPTTGKANFEAKAGQIYYSSPPKAFAGFRTWVDQNVVFVTDLGEIEFRLRPDQAPNTVWNLLELVKGGFYTDIPVHRVVARTPAGAPFVVQFGDPTGSGDGAPGYAIDLEPSKLPHDFGVLSMARDDDPDTNGSQVFICLSREGTQRLDGKYTAFAEAVRGTEVILGLAKVETDPKTQKPLRPPVVESARLIAGAPFGTSAPPVKPSDATRER